ncbi:hypothetical protein GCM10007298_44420 [Williamsia phyllosphaerae]|uniref:Uncharacterized protein n=1 Tax=Williamsia phyllosphaerae TaxID=885042 RepID=A0ABQ1V8E4_9NOCA|nr:hypothetical protein GCM10007298_44420 [Williamsia phyllosphaerae]
MSPFATTLPRKTGKPHTLGAWGLPWRGPGVSAALRTLTRSDVDLKIGYPYSCVNSGPSGSLWGNPNGPPTPAVAP